VGTQNANSYANSIIANLQVSQVCQSAYCKFLDPQKFSLQIANPQIAKMNKFANRNPQITSFTEGPLIYEVRKFADL
jgi:hypothetical protein